MKKLLLTSIAGIALVAWSSANAADLGQRRVYKAPPPVVTPIPLFTWTGCYIGGHIGGGWGRKEFSNANGDTPFGPAPGDSVSDDVSGFLGGGQIGCDYQFVPSWLIGVQGDISGAHITGDVEDNLFLPDFNKRIDAKTDWLASVAGRFGYTWDRWLIYAKGGAAWARDRYSATDSNGFSLAPVSETRSGWTVGAGVEWAFAPNWSAFLEYDFYGLGTRALTFTVLDDTGAFFASRDGNVKQDINAVKVGINYRFNWGKAPIVASY